MIYRKLGYSVKRKVRTAKKILYGLAVIVFGILGLNASDLSDKVFANNSKNESSEIIDDYTSDEVDNSSTSVKPKKGDVLIGKIVKVADGDTATLIDENGNKYRIRFYGIDAPESDQEFGRESTIYVVRKILNKKVKVKVEGIDKYRRVLGIIYIDDLNLNEDLLKNGYAWVYHYNQDAKYKSLMNEAKKNKLNLWENANAVDPYSWRKRNKN